MQSWQETDPGTWQTGVEVMLLTTVGTCSCSAAQNATRTRRVAQPPAKSLPNSAPPTEGAFVKKTYRSVLSGHVHDIRT